MPVLRCTSKLLADIDDTPQAGLGGSSPIGDWYGHIFTIERRKCILFINESTLFVCMALNVVKADYRHLKPFFVELLGRTLLQEGFDKTEIALVVGLYEELTVGRTSNRSAVASLVNRVGDVKTIITYPYGLKDVDAVTITHLLNGRPMKPIGYRNGLEMMQAFVAQARHCED